MKFTMRLDHIQLAMPVGAEELARSFFSGILGMTEEKKPYPLDKRGGCWFRCGATIVHVGTEVNFQPQRKAHPAFLVQDLDGLETKLKEAGLEVVWDDAIPDRRRFYTTDPFLNRIEFISEGDGFTQRNSEQVRL